MVFKSMKKSNQPGMKPVKPVVMVVPTFEPDKVCAQKSFQTTLAIGRRGSGLAFHFHEDGWNELFHGRKRWFFYGPVQTPVASSPLRLSLRSLRGSACVQQRIGDLSMR